MRRLLISAGNSSHKWVSATSIGQQIKYFLNKTQYSNINLINLIDILFCSENQLCGLQFAVYSTHLSFSNPSWHLSFTAAYFGYFHLKCQSKIRPTKKLKELLVLMLMTKLDCRFLEIKGQVSSTCFTVLIIFSILNRFAEVFNRLLFRMPLNEHDKSVLIIHSLTPSCPHCWKYFG